MGSSTFVLRLVRGGFVAIAVMLSAVLATGCSDNGKGGGVPPTSTVTPVPTDTVAPTPTLTPLVTGTATPAFTATPVPTREPAVPAAVAAVISVKCAGCHVALPAGHTGAQASDQCGLCHIPYGHVTTPPHTETTVGCPLCHRSPEETHFFLRDEQDQTVLASDAEERCIACHRDGAVNQNGKGVPPLETEEDILAAAEQGTLRSWIQPGGFMAHQLSRGEAVTLTDWVDEISTDRALGYDPYLDAVRLDSDPAADIGALLDTPAWDSAPAHAVSIRPTIYTATDSITMKALYSDDYLYVRVEYLDSTASMTRSGSWVLDSGSWRHPAAASENDKQSEDRVSMIWNISTPDFRQRRGCAIKCHGNVPGSSEFTDLENSTMDIVHSKAARALGGYSAAQGGGVVGVVAARYACGRRGAEAGGAGQRVDRDRRIVGDAPAAGLTGVVARLQAGVLGEGLAGLFGGLQSRVVQEGLQRNADLDQNPFEFLALLHVRGSEDHAFGDWVGGGAQWNLNW